MTVSAAIFVAQQSVSVTSARPSRHMWQKYPICDINKAGLAHVAKVFNTSQTSLFDFLLVTSESMWLRPEELPFRAEKYIFCININRSTK